MLLQSPPLYAHDDEDGSRADGGGHGFRTDYRDGGSRSERVLLCEIPSI